MAGDLFSLAGFVHADGLTPFSGAASVNFSIQPWARAFSLIEILVVLAIITLLVAIAAPSWRAQHNQALTNEAKIVLNRLDLKQRQFMLRHARYASARELPPLQEYVGLSGRDIIVLRCWRTLAWVCLAVGRHDRPDLPALALSHLGVLTESAPNAGAP